MRSTAGLLRSVATSSGEPSTRSPFRATSNESFTVISGGSGMPAMVRIACPTLLWDGVMESMKASFSFSNCCLCSASSWSFSSLCSSRTVLPCSRLRGTSERDACASIRSICASIWSISLSTFAASSRRDGVLSSTIYPSNSAEGGGIISSGSSGNSTVSAPVGLPSPYDRVNEMTNDKTITTRTASKSFILHTSQGFFLQEMHRRKGHNLFVSEIHHCPNRHSR